VKGGVSGRATVAVKSSCLFTCKRRNVTVPGINPEDHVPGLINQIQIAALRVDIQPGYAEESNLFGTDFGGE
jgi:hypothetical protein